jgi:hypothetical protein
LAHAICYEEPALKLKISRGGRLDELVTLPHGPTPNDGLWIKAPDDIWVGGWHFDGAAWRHEFIGGRHVIGSRGADDVWLLKPPHADGTPGHVLHWDGRELAPVREARSLFAGALGGGPGGALWLVGTEGRTLRYGPRLER